MKLLKLQDMVTIIFMGICFVAWAFLSFFVHILVAIFFPVVSGAILGLWIYMWRNSRDLFQIYGIDVTQHEGTIYRKLPAGTRQLSSVWISNCNHGYLTNFNKIQNIKKNECHAIRELMIFTCYDNSFLRGHDSYDFRLNIIKTYCHDRFSVANQYNFKRNNFLNEGEMDCM